MFKQAARIHSPYPSHYSHQPQSRSTYPTFLSLQATITLQLTWAFKGILDAFRWDVVVRTATRYVQSTSSLSSAFLHKIPRKPHSDREIRSNIFKSLLLNSISLTSIYAFDLILQPLVHNHPSWLHRNVGWFYRVLWLLPVVGLSYYLNVRT